MYKLLGPPPRTWRAVNAKVVALFIATLVCCVAARVSANTVTYTTTGEFSLGGGSGSTLSTTTTTNDTISNGGISIEFMAGGATINAPSNIGLGTFHVSGATTGTFADNFTLTVNQTVPLPGGSMAFGSATVSGTITVSNSQATVLFTSPLSITIPGSPNVTYEIASADGHVAGQVFLNSPTQNTGAGLGNTTIQGTVVVPLPATASMGLVLLAGLGGLGAIRRMRNNKTIDA